MTNLETAVRDLQAKTIDPVCGMEVEPGRSAEKKKSWTPSWSQGILIWKR